MKTNMIQPLTETSFAILTDDIEIIEGDIIYLIPDDIIEYSYFEYEDEGTASVYGYKRAFIYYVNKPFARKNENGNYDIFNQDGSIATRLEEAVYPVNSEFSALYEHPNGIELTLEDVKKLNIIVEQ